MNLGLHVGLTSSLWSLRQFTPLRKAGPSIVSKTCNLRPISLASDMASVLDALWLSRCASRLQSFCDPGQQGGVGDAGSLVIALISHAQIREYQGLETYWAMAAGALIAIGCSLTRRCAMASPNACVSSISPSRWVGSACARFRMVAINLGCTWRSGLVSGALKVTQAFSSRMAALPTM